MHTVGMPRRLVFAMVFVLGTMAAVVGAANIDPAHAVAQGCMDSEMEDSYSMQCVPSTVPDFNDQLTEAEVAEPGFNSHPGGGGGGGGHR
jgi:hypothetical protein